MFLAGPRPRQQCRSGAPCAQEEDAARRCVSRDETQEILREAFRKGDTGTGRSDPASPQARAQEGPARRYRRSQRKEGAAPQTHRVAATRGRRRTSTPAVMPSPRSGRLQIIFWRRLSGGRAHSVLSAPSRGVQKPVAASFSNQSPDQKRKLENTTGDSRLKCPDLARDCAPSRRKDTGEEA